MKLSHGFRSRFEFEFAQYLAKSKIKYKYEKDKFRYIVPIKSYTPDFYLMNYGFYLVESPENIRRCRSLNLA